MKATRSIQSVCLTISSCCWQNADRLQIANCKLQIADCRLKVEGCRPWCRACPPWPPSCRFNTQPGTWREVLVEIQEIRLLANDLSALRDFYTRLLAPSEPVATAD